MCCICNSDCCRRYFPEWTYETSMKLFCIKLLIVFVIACVILFVEEMENQVFSDAKITWESVAFVAIYGIFLGYLTVLYWPYQHRIAPLWLQSILYFIWFVFTATVFLAGWGVFDLPFWERSDIQTDAFDLWTIGHTLSGIVLGFVMPWWQTFFMLTIWEVLERYWTVGLGDGESDANQIVDIVVAVIGWWCVILIFSRSRKDIPWISSRNANGNQGECYYTDTKSHVSQSSSNNDGQTGGIYWNTHV